MPSSQKTSFPSRVIRHAAKLAPSGVISHDRISGRYWLFFVLSMTVGILLIIAAFAILLVFIVMGMALMGTGLVVLVAALAAGLVAMLAGLALVNVSISAARRENPEAVRQAAFEQHWARVRYAGGGLTPLGWSMIASVTASGGLLLWHLIHH